MERRVAIVAAGLKRFAIILAACHYPLQSWPMTHEEMSRPGPRAA